MVTQTLAALLFKFRYINVRDLAEHGPASQQQEQGFLPRGMNTDLQFNSGTRTGRESLPLGFAEEPVLNPSWFQASGKPAAPLGVAARGVHRECDPWGLHLECDGGLWSWQPRSETSLCSSHVHAPVCTHAPCQRPSAQHLIGQETRVLPVDTHSRPLLPGKAPLPLHPHRTLQN